MLAILNLETLNSDNFAIFYNAQDLEVGDWNILMKIKFMDIQTDDL